jgi:hypothetical protein
MNKDKIILDLCGGTGSWSKPYLDAEYKVYNITLSEYDLLDEKTVKHCIGLNPYGILFAVECTPWANSGACWFDKRTSREIFYYSQLLVKGLRIIMESNPKFWCIENPVGKMRNFLGDPVMTFNPCDYGDAYKKRTLLWGKFNSNLKKNEVDPIIPSPFHQNLGGKSARTKMLRSMTPQGFAKAFYEVNK